MGEAYHDWNAAVLPEVICFIAGKVLSNVVDDDSDTSFPVLCTFSE